MCEEIRPQLSLHPDAARSFDGRAEKLLASIEEEKLAPPSTPRFKTRREAPNVEVGDGLERQSVDGFGDVHSRQFLHGGQWIGLSGPGHSDMLKLAESVQKVKAINRFVSEDFVRDVLFSWIKERYLESTMSGFTAYFLDRAAAALSSVQVFIPIVGLEIEETFELGRIQFTPIDEELLEHWRQDIIAEDKKSVSKKNEFIGELRDRFLGLTAAMLTIKAERERATEVAFEECDRALAVLRLFSEANFIPEVYSNVELYRLTADRGQRYIISDYDAKHMTYASRLAPAGRDWRLSKDQLSMMMESGLVLLNALLVSENRSQYQRDLLNSLMIYSRHTLQQNIEDKIVYLLIAVESILLRDSSEFIQQAIAERVAFLISEDLQERKAIVKDMKALYTARSKYIHHGQMSFSDSSLVSRVLRYSWRVFIALLNHMAKISTKEELFEELDDLKLS